MEVKENYNAFKGNSKLGIKTGVQKPKPLKSSTETKLQLQTIRPEELKGNTNVNHLLDTFVTYLTKCSIILWFFSWRCTVSIRQNC